MQLSSLLDEEYARANWKNLRPFFCRLSPEVLWAQVRDHLLEELEEELQARKAKDFAYKTYFTYPSSEQMSLAHQRIRGLMMSEIREVMGYRAAEALTTLAGAIRLEPAGQPLEMMQECFTNLWNEFSSFSYSRGYRTNIVRSNLVLMLASNNIFPLTPDSTWHDSMRHYFESANEEWNGTPLVDLYPHVIKILGGHPTSTQGNPITEVRWDLSKLSSFDMRDLCRSLYWEQGEPEEDIYMPGVMISSDRRGSSQPPSDAYLLPLHCIEVNCGDLGRLDLNVLKDPFERLAMHWVLSLDLRRKIVTGMGTRRPFTAEQVAKTIGEELYSVRVTLGQMIKVGLVDFDKFRGESWDAQDQEYQCKPEAEIVAMRSQNDPPPRSIPTPRRSPRRK